MRVSSRIERQPPSGERFVCHSMTVHVHCATAFSLLRYIEFEINMRFMGKPTEQVRIRHEVPRSRRCEREIRGGIIHAVSGNSSRPRSIACREFRIVSGRASLSIIDEARTDGLV